MAVRATGEINAQVALIKEEINKRAKDTICILNAPRPDLFSKYVRLVPYPRLTPTISFVAVYNSVKRRMDELESIISGRQRNRIQLGVTRTLPPEEFMKEIVTANSETRLIELCDEYKDSLSKVHDQLTTIQGLFESLADVLRLFSIPVVGIVARYAV
ncbi:MAG TPA: hypothetical protein VLG44_00170 [Chlamydiales bacterium]|nr:hypothetical protein [Chlamydiales bacterium]